jgi:hypothetical protein
MKNIGIEVHGYMVKHLSTGATLIFVSVQVS